MKRYIEIVYDNIGCMNSTFAGINKYQIAQELFDKDILPSIGLRGDKVVLRLLRKGCQDAVSYAETFPNQRNILFSKIIGINHDQGNMKKILFVFMDNVHVDYKTGIAKLSNSDIGFY